MERQHFPQPQDHPASAEDVQMSENNDDPASAEDPPTTPDYGGNEQGYRADSMQGDDQDGDQDQEQQEYPA